VSSCACCVSSHNSCRNASCPGLGHQLRANQNAVLSGGGCHELHYGAAEQGA
jgi:hypothetical protein